jgi:HK97 family phage portal protein
MPLFKNVGRAIGAGVKQFFFQEASYRSFTYGGSSPLTSRIDYGIDASDLWKNNSVYACLRFLKDVFPEAPVAVAGRGMRTAVSLDHQHPLAALIRNPNPYYGRSTLWAGTIVSFVLDGNAYWFKVRNDLGEVVELWYRPHWMVEPRREKGSSEFITHYDYRPPGAGAPQRVPSSEVVHLRDGIDPENEMKGFGRVKPLLRTVITDSQADRFCERMLANMGVPGAIIAPKVDMPPIPPDKAEDIKRNYRERVSGDNAGSPLILSAPFDITFPDIQIDGAALLNIKKISQSDIAAAIGLPAVVVGFLVGLETATAKASHEDARRQAYESCIIPIQSSITEDVDITLLPDMGDATTQETVFDYSLVPALQENQDELHSRAREDYRAGLIDRAEALRMIGLTPKPTDKGVYYQQTIAKMAGSGSSSSGGAIGRDGDSDGQVEDALNAADTAKTRLVASGNGAH